MGHMTFLGIQWKNAQVQTTSPFYLMQADKTRLSRKIYVRREKFYFRKLEKKAPKNAEFRIFTLTANNWELLLMQNM